MRVACVLRTALAVLGLALPVAVSAAPGKCDRLVATGAVDNPPFLWRDPQQPERLIGANADLAQRIADEIGVELQILPFGDAEAALAEVAAGRADLLLDAVLMSERLTALDFIHPAITTLQIVPWVRELPEAGYLSREDLAGQQGVRLEEGAMGAQFDEFARAHLNLGTTADLGQALQALAAGRIDYVLHERYATAANAAALGLIDELQVLQPPVLSTGMHLAVGHDSACNSPWLRGQLALKMTELRAAGVPKQLLSDNLERWLEQQHQLAPEAPIQD